MLSARRGQLLPGKLVLQQFPSCSEVGGFFSPFLLCVAFIPAGNMGEKRKNTNHHPAAAKAMEELIIPFLLSLFNVLL